jgi:hypothetical protein
MHLPCPLWLFLLGLIPSQSSASSSHAIRRLHNTAIRHSAGLARDLRVAFQPILVTKRANNSSLNKVYCIAANTKQVGNGTSAVKPGKGSGTGTAGGAVPTQTGSQSSPWTLTESHGGNNFFDGWDFFTGADPTHGAVQFVDEDTGVRVASRVCFEIHLAFFHRDRMVW